MKKSLLPFILLFGLLTAHAQGPKFYPSSYVKVVSSPDTLRNAFCGGLAHPMFGNIDLNGDGLQDLVIFERSIVESAVKVLPFLSMGGKDTRYLYAPQYESIFPGMFGWGYMRDFNGDGKPDIFTMTDPNVNTTGLSVFKNVSTGKEVKFELYKQEIQFDSKNGWDHLSLSTVEMPEFADVDRDGDIDILTFAGELSHVRYYKNNTLEKYGNKDSLDFEIRDQCWGKFYEYDSFVANVMKLGYECSNFMVKRSAHSGSTIMGYDAEDDKDLDVVISDASYPNLTFLLNGRKNGAATPLRIDSIISQKKNFPDDYKVNIPNMPLGFLVDVDNDGVLDMVASPMEVGTSLRNGFTWYYRNTNSNLRPNFVIKDTNFLEKTILDWGNYSVPAFFDYNGDGLPDLLIKAETQLTQENDTNRLVVYVNIGTKNKPVYKLQDDNYLGLKDSGYLNLYPCMADLDKDGKTDLLLGNQKGQILFFKNVSGGSKPQFVNKGMLNYVVNSQTTVIDVGNASAPTVGDIDGDGKNDMLVGNSGGMLHYYRNITTGSGNPVFEKVTDTFGGIRGANYVRNSSPCLTDLDGNRHMDLVLGNSNGLLTFYMDIDKQTGSFKPAMTRIWDFGKYSFENPDFGYVTTVAAANLDGDTLPDLMVGNYRGGLYLLTSINHGYDTLETGIAENYRPAFSEMSMYPNPAADKLSLKCINERNAFTGEFHLLDLLGRSVYTTGLKFSTAENTFDITLPALNTGVYLVKITNTSGELLYSSKLLINRK